MPILGRLHTLLAVLAVGSVFGFHQTFLLSVLVGIILIYLSPLLEHLSLNYDHRYGFFVLGSFKEVSEILCLILLSPLGFKSLYSPRFSRGSIQFLCALIGKSKHGLCSENLLDGNFDLGLLKDVPLNDSSEEITQKSNSCPVSDRKTESDSDEGYDVDSDSDLVREYTEEADELHREEDSESDVLALRKLIKIERRRADAATADLVKERAASATAAEEAMAMILRLQNEKSSIEMEANQYRRMVEEKQMHDQQVIESLQWLVWRNEREASLLQEELNGLLKSGELEEGVEDVKVLKDDQE